ncbi:hypothetical protein [Parabacteroides pacaensis]|uniref:hypothetical protein n=1 Tax=Parabacteroides pacaensis TaxID=2086575 RepID=UPI000D112500|nr:hypothetical protein [Parabacteroides pacaensis]
MKTILQALKDEIHYKLSSGFYENRLLARGLNGNDECTTEVFNGNSFQGAVADCLRSLVQAQNYTEGDVSMSLSDKKIEEARNLANSIYRSIGESDKCFGEPTVYIGG